MNYLVVFEASYWSAGYDDKDPGYSQTYETVKYFENSESLERYLLDNHEKSYKDKIKHVFKVQKLNPVFKLGLEL